MLSNPLAVVELREEFSAILAEQRLILQLDADTRGPAAVMAELGNGLMVAPPAAPPQDEIQRGSHHPLSEFPQQSSYFLKTEAESRGPAAVETRLCDFFGAAGPGVLGLVSPGWRPLGPDDELLLTLEGFVAGTRLGRQTRRSR